MSRRAPARWRCLLCDATGTGTTRPAVIEAFYRHYYLQHDNGKATP